jgi:hypothetical protein
MPSVFDLIRKPSEDIAQRARNQDLSGRGSMRKGEKIAALAEEDISEELTESVLNNKKTDDGDGLVGLAKEAGIGSPHSFNKAELQKRLLEKKLGTGSSRASSGVMSESSVVPESDEDGFDRLPQSDRQTHFESAEARANAIQQFAQRAASRAVEEQSTYVVVESFRPKDSKEPLKIQRPYMDRHPDTIAVFEARSPHLVFPIKSANKNPVYREQA